MEAEDLAESAAEYVQRGRLPECPLAVRTDGNINHTVPQRVSGTRAFKLSMRVNRPMKDCRVVVRAPRRLSQARIDDFVASHAGWIARHLEQQRRRAALAPSAPTQAEIGALKEKARQVLPPKIAYYSEKMGLFPTGVRITSARTRYGSCSGKNSLCFSCFLMNCPDAAMDLVVVHELCHIQVKNHGPDFYALLEQVLPDWRERKKLLR